MRLWLQVTLSAATLATAAPASAQFEDAHPVAQYVLVNRYSDKDVGAAGSDGYAVVAVHQSLATNGILLKRDGRGLRSYRSVSTSGLKSFVKGLTLHDGLDGARHVRTGSSVRLSRHRDAPRRHGRARIAGGRRERFRISVVPNHEQEGVFVLHRTPGTGERFDYQIGLHQRPGRARAPACAMIAAELRSTGPVEAGTS